MSTLAFNTETVTLPSGNTFNAATDAELQRQIDIANANEVKHNMCKGPIHIRVRGTKSNKACLEWYNNPENDVNHPLNKAALEAKQARRAALTGTYGNVRHVDFHDGATEMTRYTARGDSTSASPSSVGGPSASSTPSYAAPPTAYMSQQGSTIITCFGGFAIDAATGQLAENDAYRTAMSYGAYHDDDYEDDGEDYDENDDEGYFSDDSDASRRERFAFGGGGRPAPSYSARDIEDRMSRFRARDHRRPMTYDTAPEYLEHRQQRFAPRNEGYESQDASARYEAESDAARRRFAAPPTYETQNSHKGSRERFEGDFSDRSTMEPSRYDRFAAPIPHKPTSDSIEGDRSRFLGDFSDRDTTNPSRDDRFRAPLPPSPRQARADRFAAPNPAPAPPSETYTDDGRRSRFDAISPGTSVPEDAHRSHFSPDPQSTTPEYSHDGVSSAPPTRESQVDRPALRPPTRHQTRGQPDRYRAPSHTNDTDPETDARSYDAQPSLPEPYQQPSSFNPSTRSTDATQGSNHTYNPMDNTQQTTSQAGPRARPQNPYLRNRDQGGMPPTVPSTQPFESNLGPGPRQERFRPPVPEPASTFNSTQGTTTDGPSAPPTSNMPPRSILRQPGSPARKKSHVTFIEETEVTEFEDEKPYDGPQPGDRRWSKKKIAAGLMSTAALAGGAYYAYNNPEQMSQLPSVVGDAASTAWEGTKSGISSAYNDPSGTLSTVGSGLASGYTSAREGVSSLYSQGSDIISSNMPSVGTIASYGKGLGQGAASLGSSVVSTAKSWMPSSVSNFALGMGKQLAQAQAAKQLQKAAGV